MSTPAPARLPDLPGLVRGIVGKKENPDGRRTLYTLQCENCFQLETPEHLVLMKTHFHTRGTDRRRLCPECRIHLFPDCNCWGCIEDREESRRNKRKTEPGHAS